MYLIIFFTICVFAIIIVFAFPQFSPVPYFPSNGKDIPLILQALHIRNNQTIIDLGAGDGIVIFKAANKALHDKLNTKFVAVEINPILLFILYVRRLFHPNRTNICILNRDMFSCRYTEFMNFKTFDFTTFYIYISPWLIEKAVLNISKQIGRFDLVSYFYQVKYLPKYKEELVEGVHKIFTYRLH